MTVYERGPQVAVRDLEVGDKVWVLGAVVEVERIMHGDELAIVKCVDRSEYARRQDECYSRAVPVRDRLDILGEAAYKEQWSHAPHGSWASSGDDCKAFWIRVAQAVLDKNGELGS